MRKKNVISDCQPGTYLCANGISVSNPDAECDGNADCLDYSDEGIRCHACKFIPIERFTKIFGGILPRVICWDSPGVHAPATVNTKTDTVQGCDFSVFK